MKIKVRCKNTEYIVDSDKLQEFLSHNADAVVEGTCDERFSLQSNTDSDMMLLKG